MTDSYLGPHHLMTRPLWYMHNSFPLQTFSTPDHPTNALFTIIPTTPPEACTFLFVFSCLNLKPKFKFYFKKAFKILLHQNHLWVFPDSPSVQFSLVTQSCLTLCDPMNRSTPGLPVHHQLLEFTQTHVHRVGDAIQPSHPLSSPSPPAPNPS